MTDEFEELKSILTEHLEKLNVILRQRNCLDPKHGHVWSCPWCGFKIPDRKEGSRGGGE